LERGPAKAIAETYWNSRKDLKSDMQTGSIGEALLWLNSGFQSLLTAVTTPQQEV
jgi:hypothetical protein